jgi:hypothetical protein
MRPWAAKARNSPCTKCAQALVVDTVLCPSFLSTLQDLPLPLYRHPPLSYPQYPPFLSTNHPRIASTSIRQITTSFTSSPPAPNPLARAPPVAELGAARHRDAAHRTSHITTHPRLPIACPPLHLRYQPIPVLPPPRDTELNYTHYHNTNHDKVLTHHHPLISYLKTRERRPQSPTAARRQLRVARSNSLRRQRTPAPTRARICSHGPASAEHVGNALENVGEMHYWHTPCVVNVLCR